MEELVDLSVLEVEWKVAEKIALFLESTAALMEQQSGQKYVTLSLCSILFQKPQTRCEKKHCAKRPYNRPCGEQNFRGTERI